MRASRMVAIAAASMPGCGGSEGSARSPFQVKGIVASIAPTRSCIYRGASTSMTALVVSFSTVFDTAVLSDPANACVAGAPNESSYAVALWVNGASPAPFAPGSYPVHEDASGGMAGFVVHLDASCSQTQPNILARSGTLQLTTVSSTRVAGRADLVFADGCTASDAFDAPVITTVANACAMLGASDATGTVPSDGCATKTCQH